MTTKYSHLCQLLPLSFLTIGSVPSPVDDADNDRRTFIQASYSYLSEFFPDGVGGHVRRRSVIETSPCVGIEKWVYSGVQHVQGRYESLRKKTRVVESYLIADGEDISGLCLKPLVALLISASDHLVVCPAVKTALERSFS